MQILPNLSTLQRVAILLEYMHVVTDPLLYKSHEECGGKAENEGHEPKHIHTDIRCRWIESWERRWWSRRDYNLWDYGGDLL
jgi:hypothetical protein